MLNKAKHKTRLTQNKSKTHKKVIKSLKVLFLSHLGRTFPLIKPLNRWRGGRIETIQVRKGHKGSE